MRFRIPFNRTVAWYTLCFLVILVVMLYLRFPGAVIADYLIASIRAKHPDVLVNIDAVEPAFPPGVKITNIGVSFRENPQANFQTDFVTVKPDYMALFERTLKLVIEGGAYGGTINGNLLVTEETFTKGSLQGELRWQGLNLEKVGYLRERLNRQVTGRMRATVTFNGNINNPAATNGRIIFLVTGGVYPLLSPVMGIDKLEFSRADGELTMQEGTVKIQKIKLTGDKTRSELSGTVNLNGADLKASSLDLTVTVEIPGQSGKKISFIVSGTLGDPVTRIRP